MASQVSSLPDNNRSSVCPKGFLILGRNTVPLLADIIIQAWGSSYVRVVIFGASNSKTSTVGIEVQHF